MKGIKNNMDESNATKGAGKDAGEWSDLSVNSNENFGTDVFEEKSGKSVYSDFIKYGPKFLKELETNFAFTAALISIIGYIVIAAFGQMNSEKKYFGYLFFLLIIFIFYRLLKKIFIIKHQTWLIILLIVIITCQNFKLFSLLFSKVVELFK